MVAHIDASNLAIALIILTAFAMLALAAVAGAMACHAVYAARYRKPRFAHLDRIHANLSAGNARAAAARRAQEAGDLTACRAIVAGEAIPRRFARYIDNA